MKQGADSLSDGLLEESLSLAESLAESLKRDIFFVRCPDCRRVASSQEGVHVDGQVMYLVMRVDGRWQLSRSVPYGHHLPPSEDRYDLDPGVIFQLRCRRRNHQYKVPATYLERMAERQRDAGYEVIYPVDGQAGFDPHAVRVEPWNGETYRPRPEPRRD